MSNSPLTPSPIHCESTDVDPIIRQIVNRIHVRTSNRAVIREVIGQMKHGYKSFRKHTKAERKALMGQCIHVHKVNRHNYYCVTSGRLNQWIDA